MGKKYVMYVDERGICDKNQNSNFSMIGVIVEVDYCNDLKRKIDQYKEVLVNNNYDVFLDDIIREDVSIDLDNSKIKDLVEQFPLLLKNLKFTIISSVVKQDVYSVNDAYNIVAKNLLKSFYTFIVEQKGICGGIIMEAKKCDESRMMQQNFFNLYNERCSKMRVLENIKEKINMFVISDKHNETYGSGIELSNVLTNILYRISSGVTDNISDKTSVIKYSKKDKVIKEIMAKIYKDTYMDLSIRFLQKTSYDKSEISEKELKNLKEQLKLKDIKINEKENEIKKLSNEIQVLNQQLEEALLNRRSDRILQILSEIDYKIKGIEEKTTVARF